MTIEAADLLEWATLYKDLEPQVKRLLGLTSKDDPVNVPLESLEWRKGKIQVFAEDSELVELEADIDVVKLPVAAIGIDSQGRKFLAYRDDYLIRNQDGAYSLVKRGVTYA